MKICLINPPQTALWNPLSYPPLGLLYIAARLEQEGFAVEIHNQPHRTLEDQQDEIPEADVYGISATTPTIPEVARLVHYLRRRNPIAPVAVGGIHATVDPHETLALTDADHVFAGEGEYVFPEFCKNPAAFGAITTASRIYGLDKLPLPARHLLPRSVICDDSGIHAGEDRAKKQRVASAAGKADENEPATTIMTSRGCPYRCAFCCKTKTTSGVRYRSPGSIFAELGHLRDEYGIRHFRIVDDAFTLDVDRALDLMALTEGKGLKFTTILRADSLVGPGRNRGMVERLRAGGMHTASFGVESGSQAVLDRVNKRETLAEIKQAIRWCKECGITVKVFLIFGLPGETLETIEETKQFFRDAQPDSYTLSSFVPLPGSDIYEHPEQYGLTPRYKRGDYSDFWFYWEPTDVDRGFYFDMPRPLREARGELIRYLRNGAWRE